MYNYSEVQSAIHCFLKNRYTGYKLKRVSFHLRSVEYTIKELISYKSILGFKFKKEYKVNTVREYLTNSFKYSYSHRGIVVYEYYDFEVRTLANEHDKILYWSFENTKYID